MAARGAKTVLSNTLVGPSFTGKQKSLPCFVVFSGHDLGRPHFLEQPRTVIGRDPRAGIRIDEKKVSRTHCEVAVDAGSKVWLRDMGSANGTWVDGARVTGPVELRDGAMITVGSASFKYFAAGNIEQLLYDKVYQEKTIDQKTRVFNDKYLMSTLRAEVEVSKSFGRDLCLIMYDLDHFKAVNDTFGHRFGDHVLAKTAELVSANLRANDDLCRYGGEEFTIILRETDLRTAVALADRLRATVAAHVYTVAVGGKKIRHVQTMSLGVVQMTPATADAGRLIQAADELLYASKRAGRNRVSA